MQNWRDISYLARGTESQRQVYEVLSKSRVLVKLAAFDPIVASTHCLAIDIPSSDIDIICTAPDLRLLQAEVRAHFGQCAGFRDGIRMRAGCTYYVATFEAYGMQAAYRHLCQTSRLVNIGGATFQRAVQDLKRQGLKTEPAIAQILRLEGEPYQAILNLEQYDDAALRERFQRALLREVVS